MDLKDCVEIEEFMDLELLSLESGEDKFILTFTGGKKLVFSGQSINGYTPRAILEIGDIVIESD